jgi:hypothetical protein
MWTVLQIEPVTDLICELKETIPWPHLPLKFLVGKSDAPDRGKYVVVSLQFAVCGYGDSPTTAVVETLRNISIRLSASRRYNTDPWAEPPERYGVAFRSAKPVKLDDKALKTLVDVKSSVRLLKELNDKVIDVRRTEEDLVPA